MTQQLRRVTGRIACVLAVATCTTGCGLLFKKTVDISKVTTLVEDPAGPWSIATDGTNVYWLDDNGVNQAPAHAPASGSTPVTSLAQIQGSFSEITVDSRSVYWAQSGELDSMNNAVPGAGSIVSVPIGGGAATTLVSGLYYPSGLTVDSNNVYWTQFSGQGAFQAPIGGGTPITLATNTGLGEGIVVVKGKVVFAAGSSLSYVPIGGGTVTALALDRSAPMAVATDGTNVYWLDGGSDTTMAQSGMTTFGAVSELSPPSTAITLIASGQATVEFGIAAANGILYWLNGSSINNGLTNSVGSAMLNGPTGVMTIASNLPSPRFMAAHGNDVYWTTATAIMTASVTVK